MAAILPIIVSLLFVPSFGQNITYEVEEERPAPILLGNVANDSNIAARTDSGTLANMKYSFLSVGSSYKSYFNIEEDTGALSTKIPLDREEICPFSKTCVLPLRIGANSGTFFLSINVNVSITDVNDNSPLFPESSIIKHISEGASVGSLFTLPAASDKDMGANNSLKTYEIQPPSNTFGLKYADNLDSNLDLSLELKQPLDREVVDSYVIFIYAKDGGMPQRSSLLMVNISIDDVNDKKPVFSYQQYNVTIQEDIAVGTVILKVSASDQDAGPNGEISYGFVSTPNSGAQNLFSINNKTGEITVISQLSFTKDKPHQIAVKASDRGNPPFTSQAYVNINVVDINNHPPEINVNLLSDGKVEENSNNGTVVAFIAVFDRDTGRNSEINCSIKNSPFELHTLATNEYKVVVSGNLDRETKIEYVLTIFCEDNGIPRLNSSTSVYVQILDKNDNRPTFERSIYNASIVENKGPDQMITKVTASDSDQGQNAEVHYFIEDDFTDLFKVDRNTGIVRANTSFDREEQDVIIFRVLASDRGDGNSLTASTVVYLTIEDENDQYPEFTRPNFTFSVTENRDSDIEIGRVNATDKDIGPNGDIIYTVPMNIQHLIPFSVHPFTGAVITNRKLNREQTPVYTFSVMATDNGVPPKNSSVTVTVNVLDENDEYPQIRSPLTGNGSIKVVHTTAPNSVVTRVEAYDSDAGDNGTLVFRIVKRDDDNLFYIDSKNGNIYLARKIESFDIKEYSLFIEVSDKGPVPLKSGVEVGILIEYKPTPTVAEQKIGQNVLIAIIITCVTIVLSLAILVTIFMIRRVDSNERKGLQSSDGNEEFQIAETLQLGSKKSCLVKENSQKTYLYDNNHISSNDCKKEVSFSLENPRDSGIFMIGNEAPSPVSISANQNHHPHPHHQQHSPFQSQPDGHSSPFNSRLNKKSPSDSNHEELHRIASIRIHQKLLHSFNKPLVYHPDENRHFLSMKKSATVEDANSDGSGEITVSDSGRGGSMEDLHRSSIMI